MIKNIFVHKVIPRCGYPSEKKFNDVGNPSSLNIFNSQITDIMKKANS